MCMTKHCRDRRNKRIRRNRLLEARSQGTHTVEEWQLLAKEFEFRCVRCGTNEYRVEKDHIKPLHQGGSDSISNIQPVCARCNSSKGTEDFNWAEHRRQNGF